MISENDKQAILNGAYGITRSGRKCKYVGLSNQPDNPYVFIYFDSLDKIVGTNYLNETLLYRKNDMTVFDVIGLWEDKPEPFDLERALEGELVKYSDKPCYVYQSKVTGLFWVEAQDGSFIDNDTSLEALSEQGMWKEPEPVSKNVTVTLPRALRKPKAEMWFVDSDGPNRSSYGENIQLGDFERIPYFGQEEDAKAWFDAMQNSRK